MLNAITDLDKLLTQFTGTRQNRTIAAAARHKTKPKDSKAR
jgi:hypothetical protein